MVDAYGVDVRPALHVAYLASCAVCLGTVWWRCPRAASAVPATLRSSAAGPLLSSFGGRAFGGRSFLIFV